MPVSHDFSNISSVIIRESCDREIDGDTIRCKKCIREDLKREKEKYEVFSLKQLEELRYVLKADSADDMFHEILKLARGD